MRSLELVTSETVVHYSLDRCIVRILAFIRLGSDLIKAIQFDLGQLGTVWSFRSHLERLQDITCTDRFGHRHFSVSPNTGHSADTYYSIKRFGYVAGPFMQVYYYGDMLSNRLQGLLH